MQDLDGDFAVVLDVTGEEDGGHPAAPELALDGITTFERRRQAPQYVGR